MLPDGSGMTTNEAAINSHRTITKPLTTESNRSIPRIAEAPPPRRRPLRLVNEPSHLHSTTTTSTGTTITSTYFMEDSDNSSSVCYPPPPDQPPSQRSRLAPPLPPPLPTGSTITTNSAAAYPSTTELVQLSCLSSNLHKLYLSPSHADAHITLPEPHSPLPVHRCLLSARSPFFHDLFAGEESATLSATDLFPSFSVGPDALRFVLEYIYTGRVAFSPLPRDSSSCADESCSHAACRPAVFFMLQVLYSSSVFQIFELVKLLQRRLLEILHEVSEDDVVTILSVANTCGKNCEKLLERCNDLVVRSGHDLTTLEKAGLLQGMIQKIMDARGPLANNEPTIHVKRILRALDSDDVELLNLLLKENATTLDDAYALHYAVTYCDSKITNQLLDLGLADINLRNPRGYTALHLAAMRKDPMIILSLLHKGASPMEMTPDGRKAVQIARQVTHYLEFSRPLEQCSEASKDRLCIEILDNAEMNILGAGEPAETADILANAGNDFDERLLYLETRVNLAKLLFPAEARIAMENAKINGASKFRLSIRADALPGRQQADIVDILMLDRPTPRRDDLNWTPVMNGSERFLRAYELTKTIQTAKRFFPRCTKVIDKYMDHDTSEFTQLDDEFSEEDKQLKRKRFQELQHEFTKAFHEDKEALDASSSSSSPINGLPAKSARRRT